MATGYNVQHDSMTKGASAVDQAATTIKGQITTLDGEIQSMASSWTGQASTAFQTLYSNWTAQQQKLQAALVAMHEALVSTSTTYVNQEEEQSSAFSGIAGQL